jgi:hypothetical protein
MLRKSKNMKKKFGFRDPFIFCGEQIKVNKIGVIGYIASAILLLQDKELIVVPYLQG